MLHQNGADQKRNGHSMVKNMGILSIFDNKGVEEKIKTVPVRTSALLHWMQIIALCLSVLIPVVIFWVATEREMQDKDRKIQKLEDENASLRKCLPVAKAKEKFRVLSERLKRATDDATRSPGNKEKQREVKDAQEGIAKFLDEKVNNQSDENGMPLIEVELDNKNPGKSVIRFRGEQETQDVPLAVKKLTKNITWNNPTATPLENAANVLLSQKTGNNSPKSSEDLINSAQSPQKNESTLPVQQSVPVVEPGNDFPSMPPQL